MSRPPVPVSKLNADSVAKHPGRLSARLGEYATKPVGRLGAPPKWMTPPETKVWKALVRAAPAQLGANDRTLFAIAVTLKSKLEAHTISPAEVSQLISALNKLGFVPVDRPAIEKPKAFDELDQFDF
jgi:hypothetical protein